MPKFSTPVGVFNAAYIGLASATSVLTKISAVPTGGAIVSEDLPRIYIRGLNSYQFTGLHKVSATITYLAEEDIVWMIARGLDFTTASINDTPANSCYSLLLVNSNTIERKSYYFPSVYTQSAVELPYRKTDVTSLRITLGNESPDFSVVLMQRGTAAELSTILGSRSPLG